MNTGIQGRRSPELAASRDLDSGGSGANRALDRDARKTPERAILARSRLGLSMLLAHGKPAWLCGIRRLPSSTVLGRLQHLAALQAGGQELEFKVALLTFEDSTGVSTKSQRAREWHVLLGALQCGLRVGARS